MGNYNKKKSKKTGKPKTTQCFFIKNTHRDVQSCLRACERKNACDAVNIVPLRNPESVYHQDDINIPWNDYNCDDFGIEKKPDDTLVCYGLRQKAPQGSNPEVDPNYTVVDNDPEDPIYYSTCFRIEPELQFEGFTAPKAAQPPAENWKVGDRCVQCSALKENSQSPFYTVNWWELAPECEKCF